jgi:hypothetical protein
MLGQLPGRGCWLLLLTVLLPVLLLLGWLPSEYLAALLGHCMKQGVLNASSCSRGSGVLPKLNLSTYDVDSGAQHAAGVRLLVAARSHSAHKLSAIRELGTTDSA